ncbi:DUF551 domain-containing protein [Leclercia adecarboxylata]|uniref:DUF551 domain-containing protein n=1 Tax=Leclercia adecarboxylata TaxID=83655 RepID=UPI00254FD7F9|nr:DUF551 domain-containing protein [Leclercia adecarboxylata]
MSKKYPSKQYLSEVISNREFAESVPPEIVIVMARQLLASMEQEPVGITDRSEIGGLKRGEMANVMPPDFKGVDAGDEVLLYAAPQLPQPVVVMPDEMAISDDMNLYQKSFAQGHNACRAAMLQGAEPVQGWIPCSERIPNFDSRVLLYFPDYGGHIEDGCIGDEGDGRYHYFFDGDSLRHEPTHWMPLPAEPRLA